MTNAIERLGHWIIYENQINLCSCLCLREHILQVAVGKPTHTIGLGLCLRILLYHIN